MKLLIINSIEFYFTLSNYTIAIPKKCIVKGMINSILIINRFRTYISGKIYNLNYIHIIEIYIYIESHCVQITVKKGC